MDFIEYAVDILRDYILYILGVTTFITLVLTLRTLTLKRKDKNEILPLADEEELEEEILPITDEIKIKQETSPLQDEGELKQEIRPLLDDVTPKSCEYCAIFKDLGTMVCPNCGRPLNLRLPKYQ